MGKMSGRYACLMLCVLAATVAVFEPPAVAGVDVAAQAIPSNPSLDWSDECGPVFNGPCVGLAWCELNGLGYIPVETPPGNGIADFGCDNPGGNFGNVFVWGASGYGVQYPFAPIGPGGPIFVDWSFVWSTAGVDAVDFLIHPVGLYEFIDLWFQGHGDFNSNGVTSVQDIFDFMAAMPP